MAQENVKLMQSEFMNRLNMVTQNLDLIVTEKIYNEDSITLVLENAIWRMDLDVPKKTGYKFRKNGKVFINFVEANHV